MSTTSPAIKMKALTEYLWFNTKKSKEFINITDETEKVVARSGIKEGLVLVSAMPVVPAAWRGAMAGAAVMVFFALIALRERQAAAWSLLCVIMLIAALMNPWRFWPTGLLVPLVVYALLVGVIPILRQSLVLPRWGSFDSWTIALMVLTVVGSSGALVLWYALAQPDVGDLHHHRGPAQQDHLVAPVELVGLARRTRATIGSIVFRSQSYVFFESGFSDRGTRFVTIWINVDVP